MFVRLQMYVCVPCRELAMDPSHHHIDIKVEVGWGRRFHGQESSPLEAIRELG
jgi:hypothetical protein